MEQREYETLLDEVRTKEYRSENYKISRLRRVIQLSKLPLMGTCREVREFGWRLKCGWPPYKAAYATLSPKQEAPTWEIQRVDSLFEKGWDAWVNGPDRYDEERDNRA